MLPDTPSEARLRDPERLLLRVLTDRAAAEFGEWAKAKRTTSRVYAAIKRRGVRYVARVTMRTLIEAVRDVATATMTADKLGRQLDPDSSRVRRLSCGTALVRLAARVTGGLVTLQQEPKKWGRLIVTGSPELLRILEARAQRGERYAGSWGVKGERHPLWDVGTPGIMRGRRDMDDRPLGELREALNRAQGVGWRLNQPVAALYEECFLSGLSIGGLPGGRCPAGSPPRVRHLWHTARDRMASQVHQIRTFPATVFWRWRGCYRGRIYAAGRMISPQSDDRGKACLELAEGERIGGSGHHLARHGASLWGHRGTFAEREAWVAAQADAVRATARDPLETHEWWREASAPWRFVAWCREWAGYLEQGEDWVTRMPCQVDGTCNGFQVLALLLRDPVLAERVAVVPAERPRDLYSDVAALVTERSGDGWGPEWLDLFGGVIPRAAVKAAALRMAFGARLFNAMKAQEEWLWDAKLGVPFNGLVYKPCAWMARQVTQAVEELVPQLTPFRKWTRTWAPKATAVEWVSPAGIPILTARRKAKRLVRRGLKIRCETDEIDTARTQDKVMPNLIHSLDASCALKTLNRCDFAVVPSHDCFGALAPHMDELNRAVRESYAEVFAPGLLEDLARQVGVSDVPATGDLDPRVILDADYAFC